MADERLRRLQRDAAADVVAAARLLRERVRAGQATADEVALAAWAGEAAALMVHGPPPPGVELVGIAWRVIERWFSVHAPRALKHLRAPAAAPALDRIEVAVGRRLPDELRACWSVHDGQSRLDPRMFGPSWALLSSRRVVPAWRSLERLFDLQWRMRPGQRIPWSTSWLPFAESDRGDVLCIDLDDAGGRVVERPIGDAIHVDEVVRAPSLGAWLAAYARDLLAGELMSNDRLHLVPAADQRLLHPRPEDRLLSPEARAQLKRAADAAAEKWYRLAIRQVRPWYE